ncbi:endonuclease/exonuclease/phosphatase family protein [Prosthecobacter sp.]|uniref:endonuclease/exonuclease/phosphatase family protein n=1 Tax=Prosthecobacter sp. TaxID=1965333 RepID=UPI003783E9EF
MKSGLRVMTYNAHSCVGTDGELSHGRIAEVIASQDPDIVAIQELDLARMRSGRLDQAAVIAEQLKMRFHFHPALRVKEEMYGDAILSKWPLTLRHAGELPTVKARLAFEPRGALWVTAKCGEHEVQFINTHLGLSLRERNAQAAALVGPEWLGHPNCQQRVIFCGDLNTPPCLAAYRTFRRVLRDAALQVRMRNRATFPSRFPLMRLDYLFVSPDIRVLDVRAPRNALTRLASDHLPVIADLEFT